MRIHHVVRQHVQISHQIHTIQVMQVVIAVDGHVIVDIIRMEANVQHVEIDNIVVQMVVVQMQVLDIIQHQVGVVRQHVQMLLRMQNIQVMEQSEEIIVAGNVKHDIIKMEVHVRNVHVEVVVHEIIINILVVMENIVQHEHLVVAHVQINHQIHIIMEIHVEIVVDGHVMHDIIKMEVVVRYVHVEVIVQHEVVVQHDVDHENIDQVHEERVRVIVAQRVHDTMRIHHVVRQHVDVENGVQHEVQVVVI